MSTSSSGHSNRPPKPIRSFPSAVFWINKAEGMESFTLGANPILIGSSKACDLVVKANGVFAKHALVEYHPLTRSFWLRDLQTSNQGGEFGHTTRNFRQIYGMVNLKSGDTLRFGESVEHVFEMLPSMVKNGKLNYNASKRPTDSSSTSGSSDSNITLPIVGHRIYPKDHREKFVRPVVVNQRLCRLRNIPRLVDAGKSLSHAAENIDKNGSELKRSTSLSESAKKSSERQKSKSKMVSPGSEKSSGRVDLGVNIDSNNSNGNQLVQRIVRLQNELHRKDLEIAELKERNSQIHQQQLNQLPQIANHVELPLNEPNNDQEPKTPSKSHELLIYETFFRVCIQEVEELSRRINSMAMRDYGDVFGECYRLLQEPFSYRLMEISTKCCNQFKKLHLPAEEKETLYDLLDAFFRDKLNPISKAFDSFLPILKEATCISRESTRACAVFSLWSREFGDQLQLNPNSDLMGYKVDDLQSRFLENNLKNHWLVPSITPLLKILIYEFRNKNDELTRKDNEYSSATRRLTEQISELEMKVDQHQARFEIEQTNPVIVEQNMDDELTFLRSENQALQLANSNLEEKLRRKNSGDSTLQRFKRSDRPYTAIGPRTPSEPQMKSKEDTESIINQKRTPSSEEEIEEDEEKGLNEAYARTTPDIPTDNEDREYEEKDELDYEPEINKEVIDLPRLESLEEGACESKGQIRDCRSAGNEENGNEEQNQDNADGNDQETNNSNENRNSDGDRNSDDDVNKSEIHDDNQHSDISEKEELVSKELETGGSKISEKEELLSSNELETGRSKVSNLEGSSQVNSPKNEYDGFSDEENIDRKYTRGTDADIDAKILDQKMVRRISEPAVLNPINHYDHNERQQNAIEFWELARVLAQALNVQIPENEDADFTAIDYEEGVEIENNRREITVNTIMDKIRHILERIRRAEESRNMISRQQSLRSNKSIEEDQKKRSASLSQASSINKRQIEISYPHIESILE